MMAMTHSEDSDSVTRKTWRRWSTFQWQ